MQSHMIHESPRPVLPKDLKSALGAATSLLGSGVGLLLSFDVKTVLNLDTGKLNG
ncbi:hypothetical protein GCM10010392_59040 [Streptomyces clavifer]|nr:hypothetical protein GCM10010392_59040 [Streptomyces clavifer]